MKYEVTGHWRKLQNGFHNLYSSHNVVIIIWVKHVSHIERRQLGALFWLGSLGKTPLVRTMYKSHVITEVECSGIVFEGVGWIQFAQKMLH